MSIEKERNSNMNNEIIKITIDNSTNDNDKRYLTDERENCFNTCPICFDYVDESNIVSLPCKHKFHFACYNQYFLKKILDKKDNIYCPYCNTSTFTTNFGEGCSNNRPQYMVVGSMNSNESDNDETERTQSGCCIDMATCHKITIFTIHSGVFLFIIFGFLKLAYVSISSGP
jgi:hypothetical protein